MRVCTAEKKNIIESVIVDLLYICVCVYIYIYIYIVNHFCKKASCRAVTFFLSFLAIAIRPNLRPRYERFLFDNCVIEFSFSDDKFC